MIAGSVFAASFVFGSTNPAVAQNCKLSDIVNNYKTGLQHFNAKNYNRALLRWVPLAEAGLGPAQRQIAGMYDKGLGLEKSPGKAALWAELSFRSGDRAGRRLSTDLRIKLTPKQRQSLKAQLTAWRAREITCQNGRVAESAQPVKLAYDVTKHKSITPENVRVVDEKLPVILRNAIHADSAAKVYLSAIDEFDFYNGARYDRYVGWTPKIRARGKKLNIIKLSVSNFLDQEPDHFAKAILLTAKRRVYEQLPDSKFADPLMRVFMGKRIYGSVYPDIRNGNFFKVMRQAFTMVERLPKSLQRYIDIIDEIHYNPSSKRFIRFGTIDSKGAFYVKSLSAEGHRMMFIRREVLYSSPLFFLQSFIHEGTHAVQDQKAFKDYYDVQRIKAVLTRMQTEGKGDSTQAEKLKGEMSAKQDYANRWYRGVKTKTGRIQDIAFECEATENEIQTVKLVGGSPDIMKGSQYLKLCPEAQRQMVQWRDEISLKNRHQRR
tara:strand:- start:672 stop:2144 length:1473 start_codon:yes stop_codon:yes gene_type:complete